jgi:hypothetical protein
MSKEYTETNSKGDILLTREAEISSEVRLLRGAVVEKKSITGDMLFSANAMDAGVAGLMRDETFIRQVADLVTKHDGERSVVARALVISLVERHKELTAARARLHREIDDSSKEMRQDVDKVSSVVDKFLTVMKSKQTEDAICQIVRLADAMERLSALNDSGKLGKTMAAVMGVQ